MDKSKNVNKIKVVVKEIATKSLEGSFKEFSLALLVTSPLFIFLFYIFLPVAPSDWSRMFYIVPKILFDPYQVAIFNYPPWVTLVLLPFSFFSLKFSQALNAFAALFFISLLVIRYKGSWVSLLLTLTSFPFMALLGNVNIDWIVAVAVVFPSVWTVSILLIKPQSASLVGLLWFKRSENKVFFVLFPTLFIIASFFIWVNWSQHMWHNIQGLSLGRINSSLFPWTIPLGGTLLYYAWKNNDDLAAITASLCVAPYFSPQSLIIFFAVLSARYRKVAVVVWLFLWWFYYFR